jgi:hypothetical protein
MAGAVAGAACTVRVAELLVTLPALFATTTEKAVPLSAAVNVAVV